MIASLSQTRTNVELALRIPGPWEGSRGLREALAGSAEFIKRRLVLPDGSTFEIQPRPMDEMLPNFFVTSCRKKPSSAELRRIREAPTYLAVFGPGGSVAAARQLLVAGATLIRAGGLGVFIDNSGRVHVGQDWIELADNADDIDALVYAWTCLIGTEKRLYSVGMHALGCRDVVMDGKRQAHQADVFASLLGCLAGGTLSLMEDCYYMEPKIGAYRISNGQEDSSQENSPMHNPYGVWALTYDEAV